MLRERLADYRDRARSGFRTAFREEHTPHQVGMSFAIGIFVTAMPSGGLGIGLLAAFAYWWSWVSAPAMFAAVAVLNPFVKPAVYVGSIQLGAIILDTGGMLPSEASVTASTLLFVKQLLIGNLLIALALSAVAYAVAFFLTRAHSDNPLWRPNRRFD